MFMGVVIKGIMFLCSKVMQASEECDLIQKEK